MIPRVGKRRWRRRAAGGRDVYSDVQLRQTSTGRKTLILVQGVRREFVIKNLKRLCDIKRQLEGVKQFKGKPGIMAAITRRLRPQGGGAVLKERVLPIGTRVIITRTAIQNPNSSGWHAGIIVAPAESNGQEMGQLVKMPHLGYINWIPLRKIALDTPALREYIKRMFGGVDGIHKKRRRTKKRRRRRRRRRRKRHISKKHHI